MVSCSLPMGTKSPWHAWIYDGRVRAGHDIQMANGPVIAKCAKLQKVSFSIPGAEYMQLRNCAVDVVWLRQLLFEIGLEEWISQPTEVMCDSSGAIDWCKFGRLTVGNKHIALASRSPTMVQGRSPDTSEDWNEVQ